MFSYTADQLNALLQDDTRAKMCLEFGSYHICSGHNAVTLDAQLYTPLGMEFDSVVHGEHGIRAAVDLEDDEYTLVVANYASRFAGTDFVWHFLLKTEDDLWIEIQEINWVVRYCQWDKGVFRLNLFGNTGFKKRAGLSTMSRLCDLKFKGTLCGYASSLKTCNGTWEDCTTRGQTTQFRGFRFAPEVGDTLESPGHSTVFTSPPGEDDTVPFTPPIWEPSSVATIGSVRRTPGRRVTPGGDVEGTSNYDSGDPRPTPRRVG